MVILGVTDFKIWVGFPQLWSFIGFLLAQSITIFLAPYVCSLHICSPIRFSFYSCKNNKILLPGFAVQFLSMCEYWNQLTSGFCEELEVGDHEGMFAYLLSTNTY